MRVEIDLNLFVSFSAKENLEYFMPPLIFENGIGITSARMPYAYI